PSSVSAVPIATGPGRLPGPVALPFPAGVPCAGLLHAGAEGAAAVQGVGLAGDPGGVVGGEVGDRGGDVGRVAEPAERVALGDLLFVVGVERGGEGGLDDGGGHRVDPDGRGELIGELLGEVDQGGLARAVDTDARGGVLAGQRGDVDHLAAVLLHPGVVGGGDPGGRGDHVDL